MKKTSKRGKLFVISGPSGAGKGTVRKALFEQMPDLVYSISCTTRQPRDGERDGVDYRFLSEEEFKKLVEEKKFLEWAVVHEHLYGTLKSDVEKVLEAGVDVVLEIDVQGALQVKNAFDDSVLIFIMPPSKEELERRLRNRGTEEEDTVQLRLSNALKEMEKMHMYDYVVVNDSVLRAALEIKRIIASYNLECCL
ncbi:MULTISPECIES: guanylate kinase [Aminobacterium]|jgi:guanylate kinase|uniref:guanylate kinase n=1 Tax=Aminobacterium TaxID=81466 RepID=UPI0002F8214D|nr:MULTISPECIES: guanylate kinase [Aminobacterium]MDD2378409.1 guanylate kinase [Aminobacterium colombiense]MDD3767422.1 guanylate kinase [Aminobacterium colombiense]MDD4264872.1 guanylate kinase [Aminobacterium colombiense]MDD4585005.1 guanylate kinase [Aminobacterium colombiense]NLK31135.1 guanylate kinase [Aminobacterium colombiense]